MNILSWFFSKNKVKKSAAAKRGAYVEIFFDTLSIEAVGNIGPLSRDHFELGKLVRYEECVDYYRDAEYKLVGKTNPFLFEPKKKIKVTIEEVGWYK
jgi:hypothetical protein